MKYRDYLNQILKEKNIPIYTKEKLRDYGLIALGDLPLIMNGYVYDVNFKKVISERAFYSLQDGELPITLLIKRIKKYFPKVKSKHIKKVLTPIGWHHWGKNFRKVEFYSIIEVYEFRKEIREAIKEDNKKNK